MNKMKGATSLLAILVVIGLVGGLVYVFGSGLVKIPAGPTGFATIPASGNTQTVNPPITQTQSTSVTGTFYAVDAINKSQGALYRSPTVLFTAPGVSPVSATLSGASGATAALTYGVTYSAYAQPISTTQYGDPETVIANSNQPTFASGQQPAFQMYTTFQPTLALYDRGRTQFINSTFSATALQNLTAATTSAALTAGGAPDSLTLKYEITTAYRVFGDPRESMPVIVCTDASPTIFTFQVGNQYSVVTPPPIAVGDSMKSCWQAKTDAGSSYLSTGESDSGAFQFGVLLNAGQSFAAFKIRLYDATNFLDKTGFGIGHGFSDDKSTVGDIGVANPTACVTQSTTAIPCGG